MKKVIEIVLFIAFSIFTFTVGAQSSTPVDSLKKVTSKTSFWGLQLPKPPVFGQRLEFGISYEWNVTTKRSWILAADIVFLRSRPNETGTQIISFRPAFRKYFFRPYPDIPANGWYFGIQPMVQVWFSGTLALGAYVSGQIGHKFYFKNNTFFDISYAFGPGYFTSINSDRGFSTPFVNSDVNLTVGFMFNHSNK